MAQGCRVPCLSHFAAHQVPSFLWMVDWSLCICSYRALKEREVADPINWRNHQIPVTWPCSIWSTSTPRPTLWGKLLSISSQDLRYQFFFLSVTFFFCNLSSENLVLNSLWNRVNWEESYKFNHFLELRAEPLLTLRCVRVTGILFLHTITPLNQTKRSQE